MAAEASGAGDGVEAFRARYRRKVIPRRYRGARHVLISAVCVLGVVGYCISRLRAPTALELAMVPLMLVFGSAFVWWLHRDVLHRPVPGLRFAYRIHTLQHHRFFTHDHNEPEGLRDLHIMLFPVSFGPTTAVVTGLMGWGLGRLASPNVGYLFAGMSMLYFGLYELVHFTSHLPADHPVLRLPFLRRLREHHRMHHVPVLMARHNFNVALPLFDWLCGTRYAGPTVVDGQGHRGKPPQPPEREKLRAPA